MHALVAQLCEPGKIGSAAGFTHIGSPAPLTQVGDWQLAGLPRHRKNKGKLPLLRKSTNRSRRFGGCECQRRKGHYPSTTIFMLPTVAKPPLRRFIRFIFTRTTGFFWTVSASSLAP